MPSNQNLDEQNFFDSTSRLRIRMLKASAFANGGHLGGAFSVIDLLYFLYAHELTYEATDAEFSERDRLVLSKGHASLALYACLEEFGFLRKDEIFSFTQENSRLAGHSEHFLIPGVEITTGSLGHGLGVSAGIALAGRMNEAEWKVFCILGDGECNEGSIWESMMFISQHKLSNLITIIDNNKQVSLDRTTSILSVEPLKEKINSFGLHPIEIDGHSYTEISNALREAKSSSLPAVIIANTIKGKGVDFMEAETKWHYRAPSEDELIRAIRQLSTKK